MQVVIDNYRNIKHLDISLEDNKIHLLTGISGCGKSSLSMALQKKNLETEVTAGLDSSEASVSLFPPDLIAKAFDEDAQKTFYFDETSKGVYRVIFSNSDDLRKAEKEYEISIEQLRLFENDLREETARSKSLIEHTKAKFSSVDGKLKGNCTLGNIQKAVQQAPIDQRELVEKKGSSYLSFLMSGTKFPEWNNTCCPFCLEVIPDERVTFIKTVTDNEGKNLDKVQDITTALKDRGFSGSINLFLDKDLKLAINFIEQENRKLESLEKLLRFLDISKNDPRSMPKPENEIDTNDEAYVVIPGLRDTIDSVISSSAGLRKTFGVLQCNFTKTIKKNEQKINEQLLRFDIPYTFKLSVVDSINEVAGYSLIHNNDMNSRNYKNALSFGEKNIVALLLFLLHDHDPSTVLIIDDPVSSYDDFRRELIHRMIFEMQIQNTILLLSHDHVFTKYSLFHLSQAKLHDDQKKTLSNLEQQYLSRTGKILYFENYGNDAKCTPLEVRQYDTMKNHITHRLSDNHLTYYQKVLNLRLIIELEKDNDEFKLAYGYYSAVLHLRKSSKNSEVKFIEAKQNVHHDLATRNAKEEDILKWTKDKYGCSVQSLNFVAQCELLNDSNMCPFEKIVALREDCDDPVIKAEMSDVVHMNAALVYCLNPYDHFSCSCRLYDALSTSPTLITC